MPTTDTPVHQHFERLRQRSQMLRTEPLASRNARLKGLEQWIHANRVRIGTAVHEDMRKPLLEVDTSEVYPVVTELRHAQDHLVEWARPRKVEGTLTYIGTRSEVRYEPKGVCLIIAPWNFPFNLCVGPLVSCLAAGNTAVIKPSEMTPSTSRLLKEMAKEVFDEDLVHVEEGGVQTSQTLLSLPFDHIFFTGSPAVGKIVMRAAAEHLSSVTLELGGKSPTVVDASADLKDAAKRIAFGKFLNNGQTCIAPDYIMVEKSVQRKFVDLLKKEVLDLFGDGKSIEEASPSYSRIINSHHFARIEDLLNDAKQKGATLNQLGGWNSQHLFLAPVIIEEVPVGARVMEEEIFGPLLPIVGFQDVKDVIVEINRRPKPLALYVFSYRRAFQEAILRETSAGSACINECVLQFTHPNLPFGGVNNSGIGKSHGYHGFVAFSNEKSLLRQKRGWAAPYLLHPPYTTRMKKVVDALLRWF